MRRITLAVVLATVAGGVVALSPAVASAQVTTTTAAPTSLVFGGQGVGTTSSEASVTVYGLFEADPFITGDGDFFLTNDCGRGGPGGWIFGSCDRAENRDIDGENRDTDACRTPACDPCGSSRDIADRHRCAQREACRGPQEVREEEVEEGSQEVP